METTRMPDALPLCLTLVIACLLLLARPVWAVDPGSADLDGMHLYLSLREAAAELPRRRAGRKTHVSTVYRWTDTGCRGVRLRYAMVGATRCTTREWLAAFVSELTAASAGNRRGGEQPVTDAPASRCRAAAEAERAADRLGI
jgi:hypothetical protein